MDGDELEIIDPGILNIDEGPDFTSAKIVLKGVIIKGSVEIHVDADDWYKHGHHLDPRYRDVILHVIFRSSELLEKTVNFDGKIVPIFSLSHYIEKPIYQLKQYIKREKELLAEGIFPCSRAVKVVDLVKIFLILRDQGVIRFLKKMNRLKDELNMGYKFDEIFYRFLARACGYSKNVDSFQKLVNRVPLKILKEYFKEERTRLKREELEGIFMGASGLISEDGNSDIEGNFYNRNNDMKFTKDDSFIIEAWWKSWKNFERYTGISPMKGTEWRFFRLRPANFPIRRIAAFAALTARHLRSSLFRSCVKILSLEVKSAEITKRIESLFIVRPYKYWKKHLVIFNKSQPRKVSLIGWQRSRNIVLNMVLPLLFLWAEDVNNEKFKEKLQFIYQTYPPEAENVILKTLKKRMFGTDSPPAHLFSSAVIQQGALEISGNCCSRSLCAFCPFVFNLREYHIKNRGLVL